MQDSIGYNIKKLHLAARQLLDHMLEPHGLSQAQGEIVYCLLQKDGQTQAQLGKILKVAAPTVTKLVGGLIAKGFIERSNDTQDARLRPLHLTAAGKNFKSYVADAQLKTEAILRKGFSDKELADIRKSLDRMQQNINDSLND